MEGCVTPSACESQRTWGPLWSFPFCLRGDSGDQIQVVKRAWEILYSLSHLTGPVVACRICWPWTIGENVTHPSCMIYF